MRITPFRPRSARLLALVLGAGLIVASCSPPSPTPTLTSGDFPPAFDARATAAAAVADSVDPPKPGSAAPEFELRSLAGDSVKLSSTRGKPVLINFWATWCAPCREEMPTIQTASEEHRQTGLTVLAVNLLEEAPAVKSYVDSLGLRLTVLLDESGQVTRAYGVSALPTSVFIDRDGIVRSVRIGAMDREMLEKQLESILTKAKS